MSYCQFSLHKKSQHLWYLAYIPLRIFQGVYHSPYISETNFSMSLICFLSTISLPPSSLNNLIKVKSTKVLDTKLCRALHCYHTFTGSFSCKGKVNTLKKLRKNAMAIMFKVNNKQPGFARQSLYPKLWYILFRFM